MPLFHAIVAMSENRVIGYKGRIPWRLPEDFRWFKYKTMGATLVMGRKTRIAIGRELPGRTNLVLSRNPPPDLPSSRCYADPGALIAELPADATVWVVGGADIYREFLPLCTFLFLTRVKRQVEGDVFLPPFEDTFMLDQVIHENEDFRVERWLNRTKENADSPFPPEEWPLERSKF
jgi:dihydrofolate reductase